jgi:hypothetical protein
MLSNLQCVKVITQSLSEGVGGKEVVHHPDDARALGVGDPVKYLVDLIGVSDGDRDGVRALERVNLHYRLQLNVDKLLHDLHLWLHGLNANVLDIAGETLVEPEVGPPGGSDEVAEPLGNS